MLIQFTGAFVLGLLLGAYLPYLPSTIAILLFCTAVGVTLLEFQRVLPSARGLLIYAGLLAGVLYWTAVANQPPASTSVSDDFPQKIVGTVVEAIKYSPGRMVVTLESSTSRLRVTWRDPDRAFFQGDRVELFAKVRPPIGLHNPGGFDYAAYLGQRGIDGIVSVTGPGRVMLVAPPPAWSSRSLWHRVDGWRDRVRVAALHDLGERASGLFLGMVVGMAGYIPSTVRDAFMATGTVHILSISGSHLGLIAFLCFFLVRSLCSWLPSRRLLMLSRWIVPTRLAAAITVIPVAFYTLLAGAEIATVRSCVMIMIFLLAVWLGRRQHLLTGLAAAALMILIHDPNALFDISFQLSYLSVMAIALAFTWYAQEDPSDPMTAGGSWARLGKWARDYMVVTAAVTLVTMPVVAYHFNQIAWLGVLGNLIAVPLAGLVLVPLGLMSAVWMLVTGGTTLPLSSVMELLFNLLVTLLNWLSNVPGAEWHVASPTVAAMVAFYGLLWFAIRPANRNIFRVVGALGSVVLMALWCWSPRLSGDGETLRVTFLDVGQGDASVIELPDGQTVLIDAGTAYETLDLGRAVVGPFLWDRGIRRLDHVIATHPQLDHVGGLPSILQTFPTAHYWDSRIARDEPFYRRLHEAVKRQGLVEARAGSGQVILTSGNCRLLALNPPDGPLSPVASTALSGKQLNNYSVVARLDCGRQSFLFAADVEAEALDWMFRTGRATPVRVLKVPHHGSKGSIDRDWIRSLNPEVAVISVGRRNHYGHPAQETLAAYEDRGIRVLRTDRDGAISVTARLTSPLLSIRTARESAPRSVRPDRTVLPREWRNLLLLGTEWMGGTR